MKQQDLLAQLPDLLAWRAPANVLATLHSIWSEAVRRCVKDLADDVAADRPTSDQLSKTLLAASVPDLQRVLFAAETYFRVVKRELTDEPATLANFLVEALEIEAAANGRGSSHTATGWTALGDMYVAPNGEVHRSPRLKNGLTVDGRSPQVGRLPHTPLAHDLLTERELAQVVEKLNATVNLLARSVPAASDSVSQFVKTIIVRKDPVPSLQLICGSSPLAIGRIVVRNAHVDSATPEKIMNGLVHETIHFMIDLIELLGPNVADPGARQMMLPSPWTGRSLDLGTFVQACMVWYGLWCLWFQAWLTGSIAADLASEMLQQSASGFAEHQASRQLMAMQTALAPGVLAAVEEAELWVLDHHAHIISGFR